MVSVNRKKLKHELIKIYEDFLKNPENKDVINRAIEYCVKYGGLLTVDYHLKKRVISPEVEKALNGLSTIYQYGTGHHFFTNEYIIKSAKEILSYLKGKEKIKEKKPKVISFQQFLKKLTKKKAKNAKH